MPACLVGCCPEDKCACTPDCECLLPLETTFPARIGFENTSLFPETKTVRSSSKLCPCKSKDDILGEKPLKKSNSNKGNEKDEDRTPLLADDVNGEDSFPESRVKWFDEPRVVLKETKYGNRARSQSCFESGPRPSVVNERKKSCCLLTAEVRNGKLFYTVPAPFERRPSQVVKHHEPDPHHGHDHHHRHEYHHQGGHHHHGEHFHGRRQSMRAAKRIDLIEEDEPLVPSENHNHKETKYDHQDTKHNHLEPKRGHRHKKHSHKDTNHNHEGHKHKHEGHKHVHEHPKHDHEHPKHDHEHPKHDHEHPKHDHEHPKHDHEHPKHDHEHSNHSHKHPNHDHKHPQASHDHTGHQHDHDGCGDSCKPAHKVHEDSGCCGEDHDHHGSLEDISEEESDSCCDRQSCCSDPECQSHAPSIDSNEDTKPLVESVPVVKPHSGEMILQVTKLRVQNMCCPKESRIVDDELKKLDGIKSVRVNVIGRVVHVSHYPNIVSPIELMATLNKRHLGVSVVDAGAEESGDDGFPTSLKIILANLFVQLILFAFALWGQFSGADWYMWIAIVIICVGIFPVLKRAFNSARNLEIDLNILITITVIGTLAIQEWVEGAAVVFVFALANFLQQFCFYRVQKTISSLMLSKPTKAVMACTGECLPIEKVPIGSIIAVRQGELIPLDGIVVKGSASVDESSISGEAVPVEKILDCQTFSGTVIQHGYLEIETTATATSSTISKISDMVEDAQMNASPTELLVNKFAKYYTPLIVVVAALVFLFPLFLGLGGVEPYEGRTKTWGERALIVLVTACPCALLMATPTVVISGINGAARLGALIKGGTYLEGLAQLTYLAFDKTGTLTEGKFQVVDVVPVEKADESDVLRWAAALESKSSHPLAAAVVSEFTGECIADFVADSEELLLPEVNNFFTMEGQGICGDVEGHHIEIGNKALLEGLGLSLSAKYESVFQSFCNDSKTVIFVCVDGYLALMISLADIIRTESRSALTWLQDLGVHLAMLTGDSKQTANAVQKELKVDSCISEMKPDDKLAWIEEVNAEKVQTRLSCIRGKRNHVVGMVGDGVNDGPALAAADVGIAMAAGGSALAVEAAGVALMTNSILKVPEMICLSRFCRRIIIQNVILSVLLKLVFVAVALTGFVRVWMAVLADLVGLIVVILNGLRPLRWRPPTAHAGKTLPPRASWRRKRPVLQYETVV